MLIAVLERLVRCLIPMGPRCLRCLMFMSLGPVNLLFLECFIASFVSAAVSIIGVGVSDFVSLLIIL